MHLLLVEDDKLLGTLVKYRLEQAGYTIAWQMDGQLADNALQEHSFAAIILDITLPGLSGEEILKSLRKRGDDTPVLVTSKGRISDPAEYYKELGANDYLDKGYTCEQLIQRLTALLPATTEAV